MRHRTMKTAVLSLAVTTALISAATGVRAQDEEPLITDRPDFSESTQTLAPGRFQLEGGYSYTREGDGKDHTLGELLLRIGAGPKTEVRVGLPSYHITRIPGGDSDGFDDAVLGAKIRLSEGSGTYGLAQPAVSVILETSLPTGARAYRTDRLQPGAKLLFGWDLNPTVSLAANLNYAWADSEEGRFGQFSGSTSVGYSVSEKVGTFLEYFGLFPSEKHGPDRHYVDTGVTYLVSNDVQLDAYVGVGLNGRGNDYFLGAGAARRW